VLLQAAQGTPELQVAARTLAARIAVKERVKLRLYQPFARMIGVSQAYFRDVYPEEMAARIENIPDENLITPAASVAVPAMQGLSYSFGEPDLKELYLNLLTTASDNRRSEDAHPAFADVIKQLSVKEVKLLDLVLKRVDVPVCRIKVYGDEGPNFNIASIHAYRSPPQMKSFDIFLVGSTTGCDLAWLRLPMNTAPLSRARTTGLPPIRSMYVYLRSRKLIG